MGERTTYKPGTFCWTDLATPNQQAAKDFYCQLFGWDVEDYPVGDGVVYSVMRREGKDVAAISSQPSQQRDAGVPPAWNSYLAVQSADAAADSAAKLGAIVHAGPFDVTDAGRMAVIQDPQGAFFMVWQPRQHIGAGLVNAPGALSWNELAASDMQTAAAFYRDLFGWSVEPFTDSPEPYLVIQNAGSGNGGIRQARSGEPAHWLVYFATEDLDAGLGTATQLGATTIAGPIDIQIARFAVVQDPQGAVFALYAGQLQP